jgi:CubicO group peptidase (beta-lactamase class C family)
MTATRAYVAAPLRWSVLLLLLLLFLPPPAVRAQRRPLSGLSAYIQKEMKKWDVPGLAIAVVKDDFVVFVEGYGVLELGKPERVNPRTIFAIGSSSKAFTAAAVAMLVDEDKVKWDDPANKYLPGLHLFDPYASRELTVRDLLSHRSGLARGDMLWYATEYDRDEILRRVRFLEPSWSFRSHFGYQNIMFLAAGQIIPAVTGRSWDDFVDERIFTPLGMTVSNTSTLALRGQENVATPHAEIDDKIRPIAYRNIDNIAPAGSINSNVLEMAQWVRLHLNEGVYAGDTILSREVAQEMHTPQTIIPREGAWATEAPESHFLTYGMGWILQDYLGRKVVQHGGNIDGMHALVGMMPEEELGVVILTNLSNGLTYALMHRIFDAYLGAPATDWSARLLAKSDSLEAAGEKQQRKFKEARVTGTTPSLALGKYAGTYRNEMYGDATITLENGHLVLRRGPSFVGDLEHWHYDTFQGVWRDPAMGKAFVTFALDAMGKAAEVEIQNLAEFERAPEEAEAATP